MDFSGGLLSYNIWLQLPSEVRHKLVTLFDMPRTGRTTVEYRAEGAVVTSDGFTPIDLGSISLERMQQLLNSTSTNFYELFEQTVAHLDSLLDGTYTTVVAVKHGHVPGIQDKPPFCDTCDSKGVKHKKVCPKNNA